MLYIYISIDKYIGFLAAPTLTIYFPITSAATPPEVDEDDEDDVPLSMRVRQQQATTTEPTQPETGTATPQLFDSSMESDAGGLLSQVSELAILRDSSSPPPRSPTPPPPPPVEGVVTVVQHGTKTQVTASPRRFPRVTVEKMPEVYTPRSERPTVRRGRYKFS